VVFLKCRYFLDFEILAWAPNLGTDRKVMQGGKNDHIELTVKIARLFWGGATHGPYNRHHQRNSSVARLPSEVLKNERGIPIRMPNRTLIEGNGEA
jgi:hypothetical protein